MAKDFRKLADLIDQNFDLDHAMKKCSGFLFELNEGSLNILTILAENGPLTEYTIGRIGKDKNLDLDRDSVRRRILGSPTIMSLEEEEFLWVWDQQDFRKGITKKLYNLTLKGIATSLAKEKFEKIFAVKQFYDLISSMTKNEFFVADLSIHLIKYRLATIMSWYYANGFKLTTLHGFEELFKKNFTEHLIYSSIPNLMAKQNDVENFYKVGFRLFVLQHVVKSILSRLAENKKSALYSSEHLSPFLSKKEFQGTSSVKNLLENIILRDWHYYATDPDGITPDRMRTYHEIEHPVTTQKETWKEMKDKMNSLAKKIFDQLNFQNPKSIRADRLP